MLYGCVFPKLKALDSQPLFVSIAVVDSSPDGPL